MGIGEIISNSFKYPLGDKQNFKGVVLLFLLAGIAIAGMITTLEIIIFFEGGLGSDLPPLLVLVCGIGLFLIFILELIAPGYLVSVVKEGIDQSGVVPKVNVVANIINTIKLAILGFIYFIIPAIIGGIILFASVMIMGGMDADAGIIVFLIAYFIVLVLFIVFEIFYIVGIMRFAKYDSLGAALSISEVWADLKAIGILKLIIVLIALGIIMGIILVIGYLIACIPLIGGLIFGALILPFVLLAYSYALGTLYSEVA